MPFNIDFDSLTIESKSEDGELLAKYIIDNKLELAIALVDGTEDLLLQFNLNELQGLYDNLAKVNGEKDRKFDNEEEAVEYLWSAIINNQFDFPKFTTSLGKKLIKTANKEREKDKAKDVKLDEPKPKRTKREPRDTSPSKPSLRPTDSSVVCLGTKPRESTMPFWVWRIVDDNLGELSIGEVVAKRGDWDEKQCRTQITRCLRKGFLTLQETTEEDL